MPDYTRKLAELVANTNYEDLPPEVVNRAKIVMMDTLSCAVGRLYQSAGGVRLDHPDRQGDGRVLRRAPSGWTAPSSSAMAAAMGRCLHGTYHRL